MTLVETEHDGVDPTAQIIASAGNGSTVIMPATPRSAVAAAEPALVRAPGSLVWTALAVDSLMLVASRLHRRARRPPVRHDRDVPSSG